MIIQFPTHPSLSFHTLYNFGIRVSLLVHLVTLDKEYSGSELNITYIDMKLISPSSVINPLYSYRNNNEEKRRDT